MDYIEVKGSYYEVGKELGKKTSDTLKVILEDFKNGQLYAKISAFINEPKGKNILNNFRLTTHTYCENYINELQGLADGAGVSFDDLFLFNVDHEFVSIFDHVPEGSHDVIYTSLYDGCTNISMETKHGEVLFAHTEDINPITRDMGIMVNFIITNEEGKTVENFVDYYIPGFLSGSKLGYNSHGVVMGMNCVIQRGINLNGIPRKFMCRSICNVKNADEARQKLEAKPGMATSYVFQYVQKTKNGIESTVIETANTDTKQHVTTFKPGTFYHHCNILQHLKFPCHPEESSIHRAAVISQYLNRNEEFNKDLLCRILSDAQDTKFPIYRNGAKPDYLVTAVTGIFNATEGTFEIYRDKPVSSSPVFTFHVPRS